MTAPIDEEKKQVEEIKIALLKQNVTHAFTDATIVRFLRGNKHDVEKSIVKLIHHIEWRKANDVDNITSDMVKNELAANKVIMTGPTSAGRPVLVNIVRNHYRSKRNIEEAKLFIIYCMEKVVKACEGREEEQIELVFDMKGYAYHCVDYEVTKLLIDILEHNYPEVLHHAYIIDSPTLFYAVWVIVKPWIDPVTASKIEFIHRKDLIQHIEIEALPPIVLEGV